MSTSNTDKRILRRLRTAYAQLLKEKSIDKITVTDLTEQADMARATFYLHCSNIDEFRNDCFLYILSTAIRQCGVWFETGRDGINEACKKKNMLLGQNDLDLFKLFMAQQVYKEYHDIFAFYDIRTAMHIFTNTWTDEFIEQNRGKLTVFFTGFVVNAMKNLLDYNSQKMRQEMLYVFEIWDYLFPDRTAKT